jgi:hypothetical protein
MGIKTTTGIQLQRVTADGRESLIIFFSFSFWFFFPD